MQQRRPVPSLWLLLAAFAVATSLTSVNAASDVALAGLKANSGLRGLRRQVHLTSKESGHGAAPQHLLLAAKEAAAAQHVHRHSRRTAGSGGKRAHLHEHRHVRRQHHKQGEVPDVVRDVVHKVKQIPDVLRDAADKAKEAADRAAKKAKKAAAPRPSKKRIMKRINQFRAEMCA